MSRYRQEDNPNRKPPKEGWAEVKVSDVRRGTQLRCDSGFTCMTNGDVKIVEQDKDGDLYVPCRQGHHSLAGQISEDGTMYVGFWVVKS